MKKLLDIIAVVIALCASVIFIRLCFEAGRVLARLVIKNIDAIKAYASLGAVLLALALIISAVVWAFARIFTAKD